MANGNQAIDGMVWRPVMSDPTAARTSLNRATMLPMTTPMISETTKPAPPAAS